MKRIDSLQPETPVRLKFCAEFQGKDGAYEEEVVFVGITGEGENRRATFRSQIVKPFEWDAYRFKGRWAYGSSAETLRLVAIGWADES